MEFTPEQKNEYLDKLVTKTQEGMVMTEISLLKYREKLAQKKALLDIIDTKLANKEYESARDGKNEKKQVESDILNYEHEIKEHLQSIQDGIDDLELIERYRQAQVSE